MIRSYNVEETVDRWLLRASLTVVLIAIALCTRLVACTPKQAELAHVTARAAHDILTLAYATESAHVAEIHCRDYECTSVYNCTAIDECPEQQKVTAKWKPIWEVYDSMADAVELNNIPQAQRLYCKLTAMVPKLPPAPAGACPADVQ